MGQSEGPCSWSLRERQDLSSGFGLLQCSTQTLDAMALLSLGEAWKPALCIGMGGIQEALTEATNE